LKVVARLNGVDTKTMTPPLHFLSYGGFGGTQFITTQGYVVGISGGAVISGNAARFLSNDCSGSPFVAATSNARGQISVHASLSAGVGVETLYYIPKSPTILTNPTRNSSLSLGGTCTVATVAMTGDHYQLERLNTPAASTTTGFGTSLNGFGPITFDYVP
jgi:hypothetical protein